MYPYSSSHPTSPSTSFRAGSYVATSILASGGHADVYLGERWEARDEVAPTVFALKIARDGIDIDGEAALVNEARALAHVDHPNVRRLVEVVDRDAAPGTNELGGRCLVLEHVEGPSLKSAMRTPEGLAAVIPWPTAIAIAAGVARGLHAIHHACDRHGPLGLVHRDISPHNVVLAKNGYPKIIDLGIAVRGAPCDAPADDLGKPAYYTPEQARRGVLDQRTDVFALGIVLWEMLSGDRLFAAPTVEEAVRAVEERPIRWVDEPVPAAIADLVLRMLERDPSRRPPNALSVARELERIGFVLRAWEDERALADWIAELPPETSKASGIRPRALF